MRRLLIVVGIAAAALGLSGCVYAPADPVPNDPLALRLVRGSLVVVPCESFTAKSVGMYARTPNFDHFRWKPFFKAKGSIRITSGERISLVSAGSSVPGTSIQQMPHLASGTQLEFDFPGAGSEEGLWNHSFTLGPKLIPTNGWLQSNGLVTKSPCTP